MQFYTLQQASADLGAVVSRAVRNHEEAAIVSDEGSVILVSQQEYEMMQETLRLLTDNRSLAALLAGHALRDASHVEAFLSVEQVFYDLQD
ncbi:Prevent-host-death family protein [Crenothrix polyspora]|uniref:Prevent-host-death family protein n=1 Tax=Crenothrix polyspora TaxID=360316 RepID=A0A1R4HGH2_9GAMM|nr:type II toxin-antitoxin system Phd/YefM family antitoxin [Crenothrix polyspora]SJM95346.1 Prevent-host-death family protein [Crenothrix polyspora]